MEIGAFDLVIYSFHIILLIVLLYATLLYYKAYTQMKKTMIILAVLIALIFFFLNSFWLFVVMVGEMDIHLYYTSYVFISLFSALFFVYSNLATPKVKHKKK